MGAKCRQSFSYSPEKNYLSPLHIKLVPMKNSVKGMGKNGRGFEYVRNTPYPTAFPYGNGMVLHFYQQQESSTTKTVHKVINKGLKAYV